MRPRLPHWAWYVVPSYSPLSRLTTKTPRNYIHCEFRREPVRWKQALRTEPNCVFCQIVAGRSPARVRYLDNEIIVIVNQLDWVPLMLLVMPKEHLSQIGMWDSGLLPRLGKMAVDMGAMYSPTAFASFPTSGAMGCRARATATSMWLAGRSSATTSNTTSAFHQRPARIPPGPGSLRLYEGAYQLA